MPKLRGEVCGDEHKARGDPVQDIESLAGGTRSRTPPSLHDGVAITVPRSGALLTGLATAVGPASRRVPRRRYADAPAAAFFSKHGLPEPTGFFL